ncbi:MAG TPA: TIR domain-containing protein, partial [Ktedonobacteraceae bacterium]
TFPELIDLQRSYHQQHDAWVKSTKAVNVLYVYDEEDEQLQKKLSIHLSLLRRQNWIADLVPQKLLAGERKEDAINIYLDTAEIILLLVSANFIASDYCYSQAMVRALQRKEENTARVIPIILKECDWQTAPFHALQSLPRDASSVAASKNTDETLKNIAMELRRVIEGLTKGTTTV